MQEPAAVARAHDHRQLRGVGGFGSRVRRQGRRQPLKWRDRGREGFLLAHTAEATDRERGGATTVPTRAPPSWHHSDVADLSAASLIEEFARGYPFPLDEFQRRACHALAQGTGVLVAAPTGAGKTVIGEFAVWLALRDGGKAFYTTPLKALSNQKYGDFVARHGARNVGLLTGDNALNGEAPVVVMTTEVLRNMLYEASPSLAGLRYVVMDEVHYLQDRIRGAVWEEVLINLPDDILVASLSATVSNAEEFGAWLTSARGPTAVVIHEERPVPLDHSYLLDNELLPLFSDVDGARHPNAAIARRLQREHVRRVGHTDPRRRRPPRQFAVSRVDVADVLERHELLPAIYFIFSRAGCTQAVSQCLHAGVRLTTTHERTQILELLTTRVAALDPGDLEALEYPTLADALGRGVASHHAGMLPLFKEAVEDLFSRGLVKLVFATETLALGINMPARSVVIERLMKWQGERHELVTPGEFTQLTGRAGRRGIDSRGAAVVVHQPLVAFERIAGLASTRLYPLTSSFRPSYNMAVNIVANYRYEQAVHVLASSFGQFLADRTVHSAEQTVARNLQYHAGYVHSAACDRGSTAQWWELRQRVRALENAQAAAVRNASAAHAVALLHQLSPGAVVQLPGTRRGLALVLGTAGGHHERTGILLLGQDLRVRRVPLRDLGEEARAVGRIPLPRTINPKSPHFRSRMAQALAAMQSSLRAAEAYKTQQASPTFGEDVGASSHDHSHDEPDEGSSEGPNEGLRDGDGGEGRRVSAVSPSEREQVDEELSHLRSQLRADPVQRCPHRGDHERWMQRADDLKRETQRLQDRVRRRTGSLVRTFDRVLNVLRALDYVEDFALTTRGQTLRRVYNESDLLVTEAVHRGLWEHLEPADLAACVSALVYETRGDAPSGPPDLPTKATRSGWRALERLYADVRAFEQAEGLELTRAPDPGFCSRAWHWAQGARLQDVLDEDLSAGDFVRTTKQLLDLLGQISQVSTSDVLALHARAAIKALDRGVVAYSAVN